MNPIVSVLIPTRARVDCLRKSINSLIETCNSTSNIEILLVFDDDDYDSFSIINKIYEKNNFIKIHKLNRLGYQGLHHYYNFLCSQSTGEFLFIWNDDSLMLSKNWDLFILEQKNKFVSINVIVENMEAWRKGFDFDSVLFPIIPKKWFEITNSISEFHSIDTWISLILKNLRSYEIFIKDSPIIVLHDRYDLTGNNFDGTYQSSRNMGRNLLGNEIEALNLHYLKIRNYLDTIK